MIMFRTLKCSYRDDNINLKSSVNEDVSHVFVKQVISKLSLKQ